MTQAVRMDTRTRAAAVLCGLLGLMTFWSPRGATPRMMSMARPYASIVDDILRDAISAAPQACAPAAPSRQGQRPRAAALPRVPATPASLATGPVERYPGANALARARDELAESSLDEATRREVLSNLMVADGLLKGSSGLILDAASYH